MLGASGVLVAIPSPGPQLVILALTIAVVWMATRGALRKVIDAIPIRTLVAVHATRFVGAVFLAVSAQGTDPAEAASLQLRSSLMIELERRMQKAGHTQAEFATLLGVSQPRISDLVRGKVDRFSVDTLIDLLTKAGAEVRVTVV